MGELVGHCFWKGEALPPINEDLLYEYVAAANGLFVRGRREGLEALIPVTPSLRVIRGLRPAQPYATLLSPYSRVDCALVERFLDYARSSRDGLGEPEELAVCFRWGGGRWHLTIPRQRRSRVRVQVTEGASAYAGVLIEAHSHHEMEAYFSLDDTEDEGGFGIYAVLGDIWRRPTLRVRVGMYGHHFEIPAGLVFYLPGFVRDPVVNVWGLALPEVPRDAA